MLYKFFAVFILIGLCGCDNKEKAVEPYVAPSAGLIKNQQFALDDRGRLASWVLIQHSSTIPSYKADGGNGTLSLARIGEEPWGFIRQSIGRKRSKNLQGKTLEFSAEIAGDFTGEYGVPINAAGLSVLIKGFPEGANRLLGARNLFSELVPVTLEPGSFGWERYAVSFSVPAGDGVYISTIELSFIMTLGGVMKIRGPSLVVIE